MDASDVLSSARVVCVAVIDDANRAVDLARTLSAAGIEYIEVTLRTESALDSIARIAAETTDVVVGAGSVHNARQMADVKVAGGRFAVSPGSSEELLGAARDLEIPFVPGAATPTEMMKLADRGYRLQKFFPSESAGGVMALKAIGGPLPDLRFFPTGGITQALASSYLKLQNVACIGGSWLAPPKLLADGRFDEIGKLAAEATTL